MHRNRVFASNNERGENHMGTIKTQDGTEIYYKDWGASRPIVFSHGWPLNADAWDPQMLFLAEKGYRAIAHDRRGHGRSSQPWEGNEMDTYADDLAMLIEELDLNDITLVGHSTGGGEVARYLGRHGSKRVAQAVLIGAVPPLMLKTSSNPRWPADVRFRRNPSRRRRGPITILQGSQHAFLRLQQAGREGIPGRPGLVLAARNAGLHQGRL